MHIFKDLTMYISTHALTEGDILFFVGYNAGGDISTHALTEGDKNCWDLSLIHI